MKIQAYESVEEFQRDVFPFLLAEEARNQLLIGLLGGLAAHGWEKLYTAPPLMAAVRDDDGIAAITLRTPPHPALISPGPAEAVKELALWHVQKSERAPGVMGPTEQAKAFADVWRQAAGQIYKLKLGLIAHELSRVTFPAGVSGRMRPGETRDREALIAMSAGFIGETGIDHAGRPEERVDMHLKSRDVYVWEDARVPCCMLVVGGETPNGKRLGGVFTPKEKRRRGYASALVAAASQMVLDGGKSRSFLFTDAANPTSNHIYRAVGYEPVGTFSQYEFE